MENLRGIDATLRQCGVLQAGLEFSTLELLSITILLTRTRRYFLIR